ncbi:nitrate ABC transporter permease [Acrocarpospora phusangensis]|uniref:Nitrate ABC transporter permease n=1 Tax=Acrocarpospora phusangensis TaxID=1070424 RepID=A0A919QL38_9ACTN|nr:nitrate ABC transporter permease [Acrocarpospora phusangensis]
MLRGVVGATGLLVILEVAGRTGVIDTGFLPLVSTVLARAAELAVDGEFLTHGLASMEAWFWALVVTIAVAVPAGLLLGVVRPVESATRPLIEFLRPIPSVALIPLAILLFQNPMHMRMSVAVYAATWPVLINTIYGVRDVDPLAKETLRSFGFGPGTVVMRVVLPSAAPFIATGVRLAASVAIILVVTAEVVAGGISGVGVFINTAGSGNRVDLMIAATAWVGLFGIAVNALLVAAEKRVFRWHHNRLAGVS